MNPYRFTSADVDHVSARLDRLEGVEYVVTMVDFGLRLATAAFIGEGDDRVNNGVYFAFSGSNTLGERAKAYYDSFPTREAFLDDLAAGHSRRLNAWVRRRRMSAI